MALGTETLASYTWLRRGLKNNHGVQVVLGVDGAAEPAKEVGKRVFRMGTATKLQVFPAYALELIDGRGRTVVGNDWIFSSMLWNVVAVTVEEVPAEAGRLSAAMVPILHDMFNVDDAPTDYGTVMACTYLRPIDYVEKAEDDAGKPRWYLGGQFRIEAK